MKIYITPNDGSIFEVDFPDQWRVPVVGEVVLMGAFEYVVESVQWELDQGEGSEIAVQLRVRAS